MQWCRHLGVQTCERSAGFNAALAGVVILTVLAIVVQMIGFMRMYRGAIGMEEGFVSRSALRGGTRP